MAITYPTRGTRADYSPFPETTIGPGRKGWLRRFLALLGEARMRQAEHEIARHSHLLPDELELSGNRLNPRNEDELPFGRSD